MAIDIFTFAQNERNNLNPDPSNNNLDSQPYPKIDSLPSLPSFNTSYISRAHRMAIDFLHTQQEEEKNINLDSRK